MSDDFAVLYSVGFLEDFIDASNADDNNKEAARVHLKIVEDAFKEGHLNERVFQSVIDEIRNTLKTAPIPK